MSISDGKYDDDEGIADAEDALVFGTNPVLAAPYSPITEAAERVSHFASVYSGPDLLAHTFMGTARTGYRRDLLMSDVVLVAEGALSVAERLAAVEALHQPNEIDDDGFAECGVCNAWPCETIAAIRCTP